MTKNAIVSKILALTLCVCLLVSTTAFAADATTTLTGAEKTEALKAFSAVTKIENIEGKFNGQLTVKVRLTPEKGGDPVITTVKLDAKLSKYTVNKAKKQYGTKLTISETDKKAAVYEIRIPGVTGITFGKNAEAVVQNNNYTHVTHKLRHLLNSSGATESPGDLYGIAKETGVSDEIANAFVDLVKDAPVTFAYNTKSKLYSIDSKTRFDGFTTIDENVYKVRIDANILLKRA